MIDLGIVRMTRGIGLLLVLAVSGNFGCSRHAERPQTVPVSGSVKYLGKPVEGATVVFVLQAGKSSRHASGTTDAQGDYQLSTFDTNDGAVVGDHAVSISKTNTEARPPMTPADLAEKGVPPATLTFELPAKYADAKTSGLNRNVVAGEKNVFGFDLKD